MGMRTDINKFMAYKAFKNIDGVLFGLIFAVSCISFFILSSSGYDPELPRNTVFEKQLLYVAISCVIFFVCTFIKPSFWRYWAYFIYLVGCALLVMVILVGHEGKGAQRWLDLGHFKIQPSEVMKIGLILALGRFLSRENAPKKGYGLTDLILPGMIVGLPTALIFMQPDLGTALMMIFISGSMLLFVGIKKKPLLIMLFLAIVVCGIGWEVALKDYQKDRIVNFMNPESDPRGKGYHAIQSKIAVGSGGVFGKGYRQGTQTQLRYLPEQNTDFIFSVLAEEHGFMASFVLLSLYLLLLFRIFFIATKADRFSAFVAFGIAMYIFWQAFINIGMVIGILPVVGITLPLVSYGGTSVISFYVSLGIISGMAYRRTVFG